MTSTKAQVALIALAEKRKITVEVVQELLYLKTNNMTTEYKKLITEVVEGKHKENTMKPQRIGKSYARNLVQALAVLTGGAVQTPEKIGFITYVKKENDLKTKVKKPVNGYQAKQRKRKNKRRR